MATSQHGRRLLLSLGLVLVWSLASAPWARAQEEEQWWLPQQASETPAVAPTPEGPQALRLMAGQVDSISTSGLTRVAVGDPRIADVVIVNEHEVLVTPERPGTTSLIIWDAAGKRAWDITVEGEGPAQATANALRRLFATEKFAHLTLRTEGEQVYVSGRVTTPQERERLSIILDNFPEVVDLAQEAMTTESDLPLVELEVQVIEITKDVERKLGMDWMDSTTLTETAFAATDEDLAEKVTHRLGDVLRIGAISRSAFSVVINHLLTEGKARLLAAPNLVTLSGKPATSFLGGEIPVVTATSVSAGTVSQNIEFKDFGTKLTITPTVSADGSKISSLIESELKTIDNANAITVSGILVPGFKVRKTSTEVVSEPGKTVVISGLLQNNESDNDSKVPGFHRIPLLGRFFKSNIHKIARTELLVVVTPSLPSSHNTFDGDEYMAERFAASPRRDQSPDTPPVVDLTQHATPAAPVMAPMVELAEMPTTPPADVASARDADAVVEPHASEKAMRPMASSNETMSSAEAFIDTTGGEKSARLRAQGEAMDWLRAEPVSAREASMELEFVTAYARQIQESIAGALEGADDDVLPPEGGAVWLRLHLLADGTLEDVRVARTSLDWAFADAAASVVRQHGPYPIFPEPLTQSELWLEFPVIFGNPS